MSDGGYFVGIDPGVTGALCLLHPQGSISVEDIPVLKIRSKTVIDHYGLARILDVWSGYEPEVWIEYVSASPQMGVTSAFSFGQGDGILIGVCAAHFLKIEFVTPPAWKLAMNARGEKDEARARACVEFPLQSSLFARKKDNGRADASLIALYGRRRSLREPA